MGVHISGKGWDVYKLLSQEVSNEANTRNSWGNNLPNIQGSGAAASFAGLSAGCKCGAPCSKQVSLEALKDKVLSLLLQSYTLLVFFFNLSFQVILNK